MRAMDYRGPYKIRVDAVGTEADGSFQLDPILVGGPWVVAGLGVAAVARALRRK
jgi:hypothetical protein